MKMNEYLDYLNEKINKLLHNDESKCNLAMIGLYGRLRTFKTDDWNDELKQNYQNLNDAVLTINDNSIKKVINNFSYTRFVNVINEAIDKDDEEQLASAIEILDDYGYVLALATIRGLIQRDMVQNYLEFHSLMVDNESLNYYYMEWIKENNKYVNWDNNLSIFHKVIEYYKNYANDPNPKQQPEQQTEQQPEQAPDFKMILEIFNNTHKMQ